MLSSRKSKLIAGGVATVVVIVIVAAVAGGSSSKSNSAASAQAKPSTEAATQPATAPTQAAAKPTATEKAAPTPQSAPTVAPPSNVKQIGDLLITLNGVKPYTDSLFPAETGTHYVAVDVTAKNTGNKTYSLNVLNFRLKDSDKFTSEYALTGGPEPLISTAEMVPGQELRGYIVFKLGDGRTPVELQYQSFTGSSGVIAISP